MRLLIILKSSLWNFWWYVYEILRIVATIQSLFVELYCILLIYWHVQIYNGLMI